MVLLLLSRYLLNSCSGGEPPCSAHFRFLQVVIGVVACVAGTYVTIRDIVTSWCVRRSACEASNFCYCVASPHRYHVHVLSSHRPGFEWELQRSWSTVAAARAFERQQLTNLNLDTLRGSKRREEEEEEEANAAIRICYATSRGHRPLQQSAE